MFPLQPSNDLFYLQPNQHPIPEDLIIHDEEDLHGLCFTNQKDKNKGLDESVLISFSGGNKSQEDCDPKKAMHRDVERRRRKEMNTLYASLRSLLPLEYVKGKRATSDHITEAVNYINHLEVKINEMKRRRDEFKRGISVYLGSLGPEIRSSGTNCSVRALSVRPCLDGVEIVIQSANSRDQDHNFPLSKVLRLLLEQGISVASCVSTGTSEMIFIHTIQSEACHTGCLDIARLQSKLDEVLTDY
ncbi:transcription factor bHLH120-like [Rhodamnia argentea]|uniref:Transcription factor bHLH120-like n=1 Tax=Rhodamnia argentea TaxID=178133 RepID=A0A8B8N9M5_9MYRT|nr:transcription factor bHLH120-like [Rhodamnia argentea]XP_030519131.1 transcription factor bHLH120-like [Rhodamnia argentea]XP_030519132.1 transcription factor bHLH120-like [Rhodamnia argentea]XP_030519134.1 transcription factor bHLH120-like [Rhodamnia argentea]XP_048138324.1 transcription factor bHLH120-like [Rhodamnia argentea]